MKTNGGTVLLVDDDLGVIKSYGHLFTITPERSPEGGVANQAQLIRILSVLAGYGMPNRIAVGASGARGRAER